LEIEQESLDAVLHQLYLGIEARGHHHAGGTRGDRLGGTLELLGVALRIANPRARISRSENRGKPFSALGELLWYLSGSDKLAFIKPYVAEYENDAVDGALEGAYGPRLLAMRGQIDQFESIDRLLRRNPGSRRAVIQLFNAEDIADEHREIPCTTTLQFHQREGLLHLSVTLRSNDAYWGLPHDVFCFTMIQEMMARRLGVELGEYYHYVGSMHVYDKYLPGMRAYLDEGFHQVHPMPAMPSGNPFDLVPRLLDIEARLRDGQEVQPGTEIADPYWADIVRLLQVFWSRAQSKTPQEHVRRLDKLRAELTSASYKPYVDGRRNLGIRAPAANGSGDKAIGKHG
jgi:thymidylate synthase